MNTAVNILQNKFGGSKNLPTFVMQTGLIAQLKDLYNTADKADFLRHFCLRSRDLFAKLQRRSAFFVTYITQICSQMQTGTNLERIALGASCSTANTRKRVTSTPAQKAKITLFQITMKLMAHYNAPGGLVRYCNIVHTGIYQSPNETEAIGLAVSTVLEKYDAYNCIDLETVKITRKYNVQK